MRWRTSGPAAALLVGLIWVWPAGAAFEFVGSGARSHALGNAVAAVAGALLGVLVYKTLAGRGLSAAKERAKDVLEEAEKQAGRVRKEAEIASKEQAYKMKEEFEAEAESRRREMRTLVKRLSKREDVLVQNLLIRRFGGCGVVPSGTYHAEVETTTFSPEGAVEADAFDLLPELLERYAPREASRSYDSP